MAESTEELVGRLRRETTGRAMRREGKTLRLGKVRYEVSKNREDEAVRAGLLGRRGRWVFVVALR